MRSRVSGYASIAAWYKNQRKTRKEAYEGKQLRTWLRVVASGSEFKFLLVGRSGSLSDGTVFGFLSPDNKFTFAIQPDAQSAWAITLAQALHNVLPIEWSRAGKGVYSVRVLGTQDRVSMVYFGLVVDIKAYTIDNPRLIPTKGAAVNEENTRNWRTKKRAFVRSLRVLAKLGVLEHIYDKSRDKRVYRYSTEEFLGALAKEIDTGKCSTEFAESWLGVKLSWVSGPDKSTQILNHMLGDIKREELRLRLKFNVFDCEVQP